MDHLNQSNVKENNMHENVKHFINGGSHTKSTPKYIAYLQTKGNHNART